MSGNARQAAVNHQPDAVNGQRCLGDVGGNDNFALAVTRHRSVLIFGGKFAVQRKQNKTFRLRSVTDGLDGLRNFITTRHKHQHVTLSAGVDIMAEGLGSLLPNRSFVRVTRLRGVFDFYRETTAFGRKDGATWSADLRIGALEFRLQLTGRTR